MKSRIYPSGEVLYGDGSSHPDTISMAALAALLDHGTLTGLGDDDHTQYLLIDGTRAMTGNLQMADATYLRWGSSFTGWRGSNTSGYVRGYIGVTAKLELDTAALHPVTNNGLTLGTSSASWADLFLASGGVINWNNGTATITESSGQFQFGGTNGTQFVIEDTASAVNYLQVTGNSTGNTPYILASGSDTDVGIYFMSKAAGAISFATNSGAQLQFRVTHTANATDYLEVTGSVSNGPIIYARSSNTDANLYLTSQAGGLIYFYTNSLGANQFRISHTANSVNYIQATGAATAGAPYIYANGSDTNVAFNYYTKGNGAHHFFTAADSSPTRQFIIAHTASAVNYLSVYGRGTGLNPYILAAGSDSDVGILMSSKGTGYFQFMTSSFGGTQFLISHTASATRYITVTGSNGGNPTISTSAGALALGNGQLQWPATQSASSDANTLDDYEEGTFTPTWTVGGGAATGWAFTGSTYSYTKVGNIVTVRVYVYVSTKGSATGQLALTAPFTSNATSGWQNFISAEIGGGAAWTSLGASNAFTYLPPASTTWSLFYTTSSSSAALTDANVSGAACDMVISGHYYV